MMINLIVWSLICINGWKKKKIQNKQNRKIGAIHTFCARMCQSPQDFLLKIDIEQQNIEAFYSIKVTLCHPNILPYWLCTVFMFSSLVSNCLFLFCVLQWRNRTKTNNNEKMSKKNNLKKIVSRCTTNRCFVFHQLLHLRSLFKIQIDKDLSEWRAEVSVHTA